MNRYTYIDGNAGEKLMHWSPRRNVMILTTRHDQRGAPHPVKGDYIFYIGNANG